jgi:flagellum-specific peptidoglycan hydrolase FlgJ
MLYKDIENGVLQDIDKSPVRTVFIFLGIALAFICLTKGVSCTRYTPTIEKTKKTMGATSSKDVAPVAISDYAPFVPTNADESLVAAFIERYTKIAVAEMDKFQIPASISMGQAIIESRAGKSILATKNNNMFGIKCFLKPGANATCGKTHCTNHFDDSGKDFFRKYDNSWDSWREHSQFLTKDRYQPLFKAGKDYKAWAKGLREFGYASDPDYEKKILSVIERYKLYKLDEL